jgi:hypothetical protein
MLSLIPDWSSASPLPRIGEENRIELPLAFPAPPKTLATLGEDHI